MLLVPEVSKVRERKALPVLMVSDGQACAGGDVPGGVKGQGEESIITCVDGV